MHSVVFRRLVAVQLLTGLLAGGLYPTLHASGASRPYLGIRFASAENGLVVNDVNPGGPADKAGMKPYDRVLSAAGRNIRSFGDLRDVMASRKPGEALEIKVQRQGAEKTIAVTLGEVPASPVVPPARKLPATPAAQAPPFLGVLSEPLTAEQRQRLGVQTEQGVVITMVLPNSPAARAGLRRHDVVTSVGTTSVKTPEDLRTAVQKAGVGSEVAIQVSRGKETLSVKTQLESVPTSDGWFPGLPERLQQFLKQHHGSMHDRKQLADLEQRVQELEQRVRELEKRVTK